MVFRRKTYRKAPKKTYRNRKFTYAVKRVMNKELETKHHRFDAWAAGQAIGESGVATPILGGLNGLGPQGTSQGALIGNEAELLGVQLRGHLLQSDDYNVCRMVVFRPTDAGVEVLNDIYDPSNVATVKNLFMNTAEPLHSTIERELVEKKYIDTVYTLNGFNNRDIKQFNIYIKLNNMKLKLASNPDGSLTPDKPIVVALIDDSAVTAHPTVFLETICYYKDA